MNKKKNKKKSPKVALSERTDCFRNYHNPALFGCGYCDAQGKKTDWTYPRMKIARRQASKKTSSSKVVATTPHKKTKKIRTLFDKKYVASKSLDDH